MPETKAPSAASSDVLGVGPWVSATKVGSTALPAKNDEPFAAIETYGPPTSADEEPMAKRDDEAFCPLAPWIERFA